MRKIKILLTGGGSGGHIYPLIAVAQELNKIAQDNGIILDLRYFGKAGAFWGIFSENGIRVSDIFPSKIRRYFSLQNLFEPFRLLAGIIQALWKVFWFMPDAVFSKGGPGALAALFACKFYAIPIVIHESDSIPGLTNAISAKLAKKILISFASATAYFPAAKTAVSGNPVRRDLIVEYRGYQPSSEEIQTDFKKNLGFNPDEPLLLILGGSLGATRINDFVLENLQELIRRFQILHQVGLENYETYRKGCELLTKNWPSVIKNRCQFQSYLEKDLADAYRAADLILSRAGAGSIFEIAYFGKPSILIPLPEAANNHQLENARQYAKTGAAIIIQQENFLGHLVIDQISKLISNKELLKKMGEVAKSFYRPDAAAVIAKTILEICHVKII